jgi:hypothetical protein
MGEAATITSDLVGGDLEARRASGHATTLGHTTTLAHMTTLGHTMTGAIADRLLGQRVVANLVRGTALLRIIFVVMPFRVCGNESPQCTGIREQCTPGG